MHSISYFKNSFYNKLLLFVLDLELQREVHFSHLIPFDCELCMRAANGLIQFMQASGPPSLTRPMAPSRNQGPTVDLIHLKDSSSSSTLDQAPLLFPPQSTFEHLLAKSSHLHHLTSINRVPPLLNIENSTENMAENRETCIRHDASLSYKGGLLLDFEKYPVFHLRTYSL